MTFPHAHDRVLCEREGIARVYRIMAIEDDGKKTELAMIHEAEGLKRLTKKLGEAEIDSIDSLICACDFPMLMQFSHADAVFYAANARKLRGCTEARRRFAEDGVHRGR
jgi:hypothetical protein